MDSPSEILDLLPVACYHLDHEYLVTYVNKYAGQLFNHTPEECLGRRIHELFPESKVTACFNTIDTALNENRLVSHDYVSAVTHQWIRLTATPSGSGVVVSFSNINDLKLSDQHLEINEARYRSLFNIMDEGFCVIEIIPGLSYAASDYRFLTANPAFERHTGLHRIVGKTIREVVPTVEIRIIGFLDNAIRTGEPQYFEEYVSGLDIWLEAKIFKLSANNQLAVLFKNVSARKKAELELRRSEEQFRLLAIATSNMVYRMSADWEQMYNLNGKNILADTEHPTGSWIEKYIPEDERPLVTSKIEEAIRNKNIFDLEHRVFQADGAVGWVHSRAVPLLDRQGNITEWLGAGSDITRRKESEDALRESEQRFKASSAKYLSLFNSIDQGFCIIEMIFTKEGNPLDYRFLEMNPAFEKQTGMHDAAGKTMRYLAPQIDEQWYQIFGEVAKTGVPKRFVEKVTALGRWFDVYAFVISTESPSHVAILFNDITDQKRHEQAQAYSIALSDAINSRPKARDIQQTAARVLGNQLKAAAAYYFSRNLNGAAEDTLTVTGMYSRRKGKANQSDPSPSAVIGKDMLADLLSGQRLVIEDVDTLREPVTGGTGHQAPGIQSFIMVPLMKNGECIAICGITDTLPRQWSEDEVYLVELTAERTWDAVERANAESALRESEARYRSRLETEVAERTAELRQTKDLLHGTLDSSLSSIQVFMAVRNDQGKIVDFTWVLNNQTARKIFGAGTGESLMKRNPGVVQSGIFDRFVEVTETGIPQQYEIRYNFEQIDGWFFQSVVKLGDGVAATTADISLRKRAEEERFRNYLLLQQSEELAQSGSWDLDLQSGVFTWSDGMYRLFDLEPGIEVTPEIYLEFATPKGRPAVERLVRRLRTADDELEETIELKIRERLKVLHVKATVVRNDEGIPIRFLGVDLDISAMREAERKLHEMQVRQQQEIHLVTLNTQEEERRRISENLHNGLAQMLYATLLNLNLQSLELAKRDPEEFNRTRRYTERLLVDSIRECRRISHELMPPVLAEFGLAAAITDVCIQLQDGLNLQYEIALDEVRFDHYIELAIFRTVQELILNVIKHAQATEATIQVRSERNAVLIRVQDNGRGMVSGNTEKPGIGLSSIRHKVSLLDGTIHIESQAEKGTLIEVSFPTNVFRTGYAAGASKTVIPK